MTSVKIMDYDVEFPYSHPYDIQEAYMEKVIHCLHNKAHGVLESPTGTGKTLCLLAPVSAWAKKQKLKNGQSSEESDNLCDLEYPMGTSDAANKDMAKWGNKNLSTVWYTARTHAQIAQTISEFRKCDIKGLNVRVLGARDQLCINPEVLSEEESYIKTIKCKELTKNKNCKYHRKLHQEKNPSVYYRAGEIMDIEDLVSLGKTCGVCPYYLSKTSIETADIVFLPYNYIIDRDSRDANGLQLQHDVIIFDEGHNVPSTCEESYEFTFTTLDLALGIKNVKDLMTNLARLSEIATEDDEKDIAKHAENSVFVAELLQKLESGLEKLKVSEELLPLSTLHTFFGEAGITHASASRILSMIQEFHSDSSFLNLSGSILQTFHLLEKMVNTVFGSTIRSFDKNVVDRSFKCGVREDMEKMNGCKRVSLYCFNPSFGIRAVLDLGVQSVIITSGTLSPLRTFIHELNLPKPVTLQNGHIAKKSQVPFLILGTGVNNIRMDAAYTNRNDPKYVLSLGRTLTNLISSVPDGVLLLFSSYTMMQNLREAWESDVGIWKRLDTLKRVFVEPRGKEAFINCIENYKRAVDSGNGAIFMGVLRGKISEGMDFKDQYCRAVFIVGVPFPPTKDPRVKGKERYSESLEIFDEVTKTNQKLYNNSFMSVEAMRATNQAIGRVIRHCQDYGAIILVDYRFCWSKLFQNISTWLRGSKAVESNFPQAKKILSEFFRDIHLGKLGIPEVRCQRVDGNGCPIADNISYEEYEHRKVVKAHIPWISANASGHKTSVIAHSDCSNPCLQDLSTLYDCAKSESKSLKEPCKRPSSVFDAMECSKSIFQGYGQGVTEQNKKLDVETTKRRFEEDKMKESSKISYLDTPLTNDFQSKDKVPAKKVPRIKIKPFIISEGQEPESIIESENFIKNYTPHIKCDKIKNSNEDELKIKLISYFKSAKNILPEEEVDELKKYSFRYMKGEKKLSEITVFLDKIFCASNRRHLYAGFGVCIKSKDREEWENACKIRNIDVKSDL